MTRTITVEGMSCEHCEQTVVEALEGVDGVESATADKDSASASIEGDADVEALVAAVNETSYEASV